ncbi:unnamed protein product [Owenia fusiformis]|uniref:Uncharacterized protein n=1 Tax=Owenia fusiformis TaxID=6347 RepID=A0A8J1T4P2_OWEFU|nr:unnamed protein product [Owenia fusiformis]
MTVTFRLPSHSQTLTTSLRTFFQDGLFCDAMISSSSSGSSEANGISVHSVVVAAYSPYLQVMLLQGDPFVQVDIETDTIKKVVQLMYTGIIEMKDNELKSLYNAAKILKISRLLTFFEEKLQDKVKNWEEEGQEVEKPPSLSVNKTAPQKEVKQKRPTATTSKPVDRGPQKSSSRAENNKSPARRSAFEVIECMSPETSPPDKSVTKTHKNVHSVKIDIDAKIELDDPVELEPAKLENEDSPSKKKRKLGVDIPYTEPENIRGWLESQKTRKELFEKLATKSETSYLSEMSTAISSTIDGISVDSELVSDNKDPDMVPLVFDEVGDLIIDTIDRSEGRVPLARKAPSPIMQQQESPKKMAAAVPPSEAQIICPRSPSPSPPSSPIPFNAEKARRSYPAKTPPRVPSKVGEIKASKSENTKKKTGRRRNRLYQCVECPFRCGSEIKMKAHVKQHTAEKAKILLMKHRQEYGSYFSP